MSKGKPPAKSGKDSTATIGFEATALRDSALPPREAILRSLSAAKDNRWLTADTAGFVLANGSMSSNQSGERVARSASSKPEAKLHDLGRQRDIRRALIEAAREMSSDEMRTTNCSLPPSTFEIHPSNFASLPGEIFYSTQIPVCLWFSGKNEPAGKCRAVPELELALAA